MTTDNYPRVMEHIYQSEGGYVNHPADPGKATNMGITIGTLSAHYGRPATVTEVRNLTKNTADAIYRKKYWDKVKGDELAAGFDLVAMDGAVNSGPSRGIKWMQKGLGVVADGVVGPATIAATHNATPLAIERACAARMAFLRRLRHWATFQRGWSRRVASVEAAAVAMWSDAQGKSVAGKDLILMEARQQAKRREDKAKGRAKVQPSLTGAGGLGGILAADLPPYYIIAALIGVVALTAMVFYRAKTEQNYQRERVRAYISKTGVMK